MKHYYKISYQYHEHGKNIVCRIYKGTHPAKTKEYKLCKQNFNEGFIYSFGFKRLTGEEVHEIKINKLLKTCNIELINLDLN